MNLQIFATPCIRIDSGSGIPILASISAAAEAKAQLHDVFGDNGALLQQFSTFTRVSDVEVAHWVGLMRDSARAAAISFDKTTVLDIGSGGGISVFALLRLCENGVVYASDLCVPLLSDLKRKYEGLSPRPAVALSIVQTSAENLVFESNSFDIVTGGNILHHAYSPVRMLSEVRRVLKPGGHAFFWEPCENGSQILCLVMALLTEMSKSNKDDPIREEARTIFAQYRDFVARVKGRDHSEDFLSSADDKWMFSRSQICEAAVGASLSVVDIANIYGPKNILEDMIKMELRRHGYNTALPEWAVKEVRRIESSMSPDFLCENPFSCRIVLRAASGVQAH